MLVRILQFLLHVLGANDVHVVTVVSSSPCFTHVQELMDLKDQLARLNDDIVTMTNEKAYLRKDNAELRTSCFETQSQLFEIGRDAGLKKKATMHVCREFSEYESRACEHIKSLLAQRTEIAGKHVEQLAHLSERQQQHADSMMTKFKASQE